MHKLDLRPAAVAAAVAWLALGMPGFQQPAPSPDGPAPIVTTLDLRAAFAGESDRAKARHDAHLLGHLTDWLADYLDADGKRPQPKFATGGQVEDLRVEACYWVTQGGTFGAKYPDLGPAIGAHLNAAVGAESADLTPETRAKWVRAFREIAVAALTAAK